MRSRTGCLTCRQRKLKCDEVKPICGQCRKASRECMPSAGVVFRHQQNPSLNEEDVQMGDVNARLGSFYAYKNTFNEEHVWVDVPKKVTFIGVTDPYNMGPSPEPEDIRQPSIENEPARDMRIPSVNGIVHDTPSPWSPGFRPTNDAAPGLDALSAAAAASHTPGREEITRSPSAHSMPASNTLNFILNHPRSSQSSPIDPALVASSQQPTVSDHEEAFLMRHFSETTGHWMDLYDLECYFAHHVPVQAITNPLLKYAACAYAAKQLSCVQGRKAVMGGAAAQQAQMELYGTPGHAVDWAYIGATYYDKAISLLMDALAQSGAVEDNQMLMVDHEAESTSTPRSLGTTPSVNDYNSPPTRRRRPSKQSSPADETLAAGAILCVYEFLDNTTTAWARHLSGTKSLFDLADNEAMLLRRHSSRAHKATFWNFARQDFLAAFINESSTRFDTFDLAIWRTAGLLLDEHGFVCPSNVEGQRGMREDMISNALIWLLSKIVNFLACGDSVDNVYPQDRLSPHSVIGINQMTLLERWHELERELDIWYQGLPATFKACARLEPVPGPDGSPRTVFPEVWYSIPMCASTMQCYHMARVILLTNKPHESTARRTTIGTRLHSYRSIHAGVKYHSYEICGIALGRPNGSVRINMLQPLFVAGQCLTESSEQRIVLNLLRGIESDLGWATEYRAQQLLKEWGWIRDAGGN